MSSDLIYLDHAAATPLDERAFEAMRPYLTDRFFNPSSPYQPALDVRREYETAKQTIARTIGATSTEIIMTAGATESINLAFGGVSGHVITTTIEHPAVLEAAKRHQSHTLVGVDAHGRVSPRDIEAAITPDTQLISVGLANNEIGTIQPLRDIAACVEAERARRLEAGETTPLAFHSDASQGLSQLDVNVGRLGVDLLTLNAGKVYGPKQVGLLYKSRHMTLSPVIVGGGQELGLRSGTENVAGVIGFAVALESAARSRKSEVERLRKLRDTLEKELIEVFPEAIISGHPKHRLASYLHISFPGIDAERLVFILERHNVLVATGSACAANKGTRSHVLTAIGLSDPVADGSLRLTLGRLSTEETITQAASRIIEAVRAEQERTA
jgi:cysteine desulfurase